MKKRRKYWLQTNPIIYCSYNLQMMNFLEPLQENIDIFMRSNSFCKGSKNLNLITSIYPSGIDEISRRYSNATSFYYYSN